MVALKILTKKKKNDLSTNARNFADETMETTGFKGEYRGLTSLVVQWLRLCLPMQEVRVRSLVGELRSHMPRGQKTKTEAIL